MGRQKPSRKPAKRQQTSSKSTRSRRAAFSRTPVKGKSKGLAQSRKEKKRPKKALGPYMYYCKLNRKNVQTSNPNLTFGDIGRVLGSQWCRLNEKDKRKYIRKAQTDKRRYAKEMKRFVK